MSLLTNNVDLASVRPIAIADSPVCRPHGTSVWHSKEVGDEETTVVSLLGLDADTGAGVRGTRHMERLRATYELRLSPAFSCVVESTPILVVLSD